MVDLSLFANVVSRWSRAMWTRGPIGGMIGHPSPRCIVMRPLLRALALVSVVPRALGAQGGVTLPDFVRAADSAQVTVASPVAQPDAWMLAFIDVETTGLVPGWHELVDVGVVMTDLEGRVRDSLFVRVQPRHPERLSPGAARVNGFDAARWRRLNALEPAAAVDTLVRFHRRTASDRHVLMVAFNSQFDAAFLDHLFRSHGSSWRTLYHYFVLDLPSMAWSLGLRDLRNDALAARLGVPDEPRVANDHTGLTGAMLNVRIYQALRRLAAERRGELPARPW